MDIDELKTTLALHLCDASQLKQPDTLPTGFAAIDRFLFGGGLPKGQLTLFKGALGKGSTSLWIETATLLLASGRRAVWINHDIPLSPLPLKQKGLDLNRLISIETPENEKQLFWILQQLMASSLFDLIGCDLGRFSLREHQLRKLQIQARQTNTCLVFLSDEQKLQQGNLVTLFSVILRFEKRQIVIERASHRPTPHPISRSLSYDRFTHHTTDHLNSSDRAPAEQIREGTRNRANSRDST
jgi:recombination protein RecA